MSASLLWGSDAIRRMGALVRAMWTRAAGDAATLARLRRGQEMAARRGQVKRLAHNRYEVRSQSRESTTYEVRFGGKGASCECPDHQYRKTVRKHIAAVMQRNSDMRDKAGANAPGADPAPHPDAAQAEPILAGEPGGTGRQRGPTPSRARLTAARLTATGRSQKRRPWRASPRSFPGWTSLGCWT